MATSIMKYQEFPPIGTCCSDTSTEGEDDFYAHCRQKQKANYRPYRNISQQSKVKVKSSLCKNFTQTGECPYGDRCQFAHGTHELRCNAEINLSYKTKYCNSYLNKKYCIYGFRCNFIHEKTHEEDKEERWRQMYSNCREIFQDVKQPKRSRLLELLNQDK